jgi:hypothetical protein
MNDLIVNLQGLVKALEGGQQGGVPGAQTQGSALQMEDLSPVIQNVCWKEDAIKLQKVLKVETCKSTLAQFDRQLDYGQFGGSAQLEGAVGQEEVSSIVRVVVPMCFYSHLRRTTLVANLVATVDGKKADDRASEDAAKKIAADIEFDSFRGSADFSNAGIFDGNPLAIPNLPNIRGVDVQVRSSDFQFNSHDLMLEEYGSNLSIVIAGGGTLSQSMVEDSHTRSLMNMGDAKRLLVDPLVASAYNKTLIGAVNGAFAPIGQRLVVGGSATDASGADLKKQFVHNGVVDVETSRFLSGKTTWARTRPTAPGAPSIAGAAITEFSGTTPGSLAAGTYRYIVTAANEAGESAPFGLGLDVAGQSKVVVAAAGTGSVRVIITAPTIGTAKYFNVYRTAAGAGTKAIQYRYIGRVAAGAAGGATFIDLGNRLPGFVTGFLVQEDTMGFKELAPYSRLKLAVSELSTPEAHFRFLTLAVYQPRKNVIVDNLIGSL